MNIAHEPAARDSSEGMLRLVPDACVIQWLLGSWATGEIGVFTQCSASCVALLLGLCHSCGCYESHTRMYVSEAGAERCCEGWAEGCLPLPTCGIIKARRPAGWVTSLISPPGIIGVLSEPSMGSFCAFQHTPGKHD